MNVTFYIDGRKIVLDKVERKAQEVSFSIGGVLHVFRGQVKGNGHLVLEKESSAGVWQRVSADIQRVGKEHRVQLDGYDAGITEVAAIAGQVSEGAVALSPVAPMPGLVRQVLVKVGDRVKKGQAIAVMEAMKLQTTLTAGGDAIVEAVLVQEGGMVAEGAELVKLKGV